MKIFLKILLFLCFVLFLIFQIKDSRNLLDFFSELSLSNTKNIIQTIKNISLNPEDMVLGKWTQHILKENIADEEIIEFFKDQSFVIYGKNNTGGSWVVGKDKRVKLELNNILGSKSFLFARVNGNSLELEVYEKDKFEYFRTGSREEQDQLNAIKAIQLYNENKYNETIQFATVSAEHGNAPANFILGKIYANGLGIEKNYSKSLNHFKIAADNGYVDALNSVAWYLATIPITSMQDGKKAVEYSLKAMKANPNIGNYIDTYAVALARTGEFTKAIEQEDNALRLLYNEYEESYKFKDSDVIYEIVAHRELFKSGKAYDLSMETDPEFITLVNRLKNDGIGIILGMPVEITAIKLFQGIPHPFSNIPPLGNRYYLTEFPQVNVFGVEVYYNVLGLLKVDTINLKIDCEPRCKENLFNGNIILDAKQGVGSYVSSSKFGNFYNYENLPENNYKLTLNMHGGEKPIRIFSKKFSINNRWAITSNTTSTPSNPTVTDKTVEKHPASATKDRVESNIVTLGSTYVTESFSIDKPERKTIVEKKIVAKDNEKLTVESTNIKSKSHKPRILEYTNDWNLLSSRNTDGSGSNFSPPIKYFDFPLYPGKKWQGKTTETNIKTGAIRQHSISAIVGEWETVSVPAGTFQGIKIIIETELIDSTTGEKTTGTDTSWYVPQVARSVKSITSSRNAEGKEQQQINQLISYKLMLENQA